MPPQNMIGISPASMTMKEVDENYFSIQEEKKNKKNT